MIETLLLHTLYQKSLPLSHTNIKIYRKTTKNCNLSRGVYPTSSKIINVFERPLLDAVNFQYSYEKLRGDFKTQPPVDRWFRPVVIV